MTTLISGAAFGAALVSSGVVDPAVIISQFRFEYFDMIQTFLAATATTSIVIAALDKLGYAKVPPRCASSLNIFSRHDGNIIGGSLLGAGMALSASCPGSAIAAAALGIRPAYYALGGATVGGILYSGVLAPIIARRRQSLAAKTTAEGGAPAPPPTIYERAHVSKFATLLVLEAFYGAVVAAAYYYAPASPYKPLVAPALGGVLIGGTQLLSLLLRKCLVGVSSVYEDIGKYFSWFVKGASGPAPTSYTSIVFAAGLAAGVYALRVAYPSVVPAPDPRVSDLQAALGGFLFALGARIAGGCTSGHGISGISLLSTSSFITIASTFAAGGAVARAVY